MMTARSTELAAGAGLHMQGTVFVIDDDEAVRDSIRWLLEGNGFTTRCFDSAEAFLAADAASETNGCVLVDVRMPGLSGLALQDELKLRGCTLPLVFITGHGDVPMAVETMKKGAVDFLQKPFSEERVRSVVEQCLRRSGEHHEQAVAERDAVDRIERLTSRERQVLERIVAGRLNKQIADDLNISIKTVEAHRSNIMEKLLARSMADLMRVAIRAGFTDTRLASRPPRPHRKARPSGAGPHTVSPNGALRATATTAQNREDIPSDAALKPWRAD
jgi:FixJ family two-component response regulator